VHSDDENGDGPQAAARASFGKWAYWLYTAVAEMAHQLPEESETGRTCTFWTKTFSIVSLLFPARVEDVHWLEALGASLKTIFRIGPEPLVVTVRIKEKRDRAH
jgi:hypothetical protein